MIESQFTYWPDDQRHTPFDQLSLSDFLQAPPEGVSVEQDHYWIQFDLVNPLERDQEWVLDFSQWTHAEVYFRPRRGGDWQRKQTGTLVPFRERDHGVTNRAYVRLPIMARDTVSCLVRLETGVNYILRPSAINYEIMPIAVQAERDGQVERLVFMFLGIYIIMFLYNFFIFVSTRDASYRYYLILLLIMVFILLHNFGYFHQIFKGIDAWASLHGYIEVFISALLGVMLFLFASSFLDVKRRLPKAQKVFYALMGVAGLTTLPSFFGYALVGQILSSMVGIIAMSTIITVGVISYRRGTPSAGFFLLAYGFFLICLITYLAGFESGLLRSPFSPFLVQLGSTGEIVLFSFALANRINILRRDNEAKQKELIAQLRTNQELQEKVNRELEEKVKERTAEIEAEKEKSDELLLNILPSSTAEELKAKGFASTQEYAEATVLFTDFKGFTTFTSSLSAQELVRGLDYCFRGFDDIVERHGLEKIKTIGDAYMCVGGVPDVNDSHAVNSVKAALEMIEFMDHWQAEQEKAGVPIWEVRIGIHTGPVIAGVVGKKKFAFDIWGDTVNIASRMESHGSVGKINVSEATYALTKDEFDFDPRGLLPVKGKGDLHMYFLKESTTLLPHSS